MRTKEKRTKQGNGNRKKSQVEMMLQDPSVVAQLGAMIGMGMVQAQQAFGNGTNLGLAYKETSLTPTSVSIYGRYSIFDPCVAGDIYGLQVVTHGFMNWLGWRSNRFYRRRVDFLTYQGPAGTAAGTADTGATDPCDDPPGWEYGTCGYELVHTSWYGRSGDALTPFTVVQERCETSPRYRINGQQIVDDVEWQVNGAMGALKMSLERDLIHGSHANPNEMDGLNRIIRGGHTDDNGQPCPMVDSIMVNWANDNLDGESNNYGNFFNYMDEIVTEIEYRASGLGSIAETDMILLTSRFMATCLLDAFACHTTCGVTDANDITDQALRAQQRQARRDLNAGPLYDGRNAVGYIHLKSGRRLPIMVEDTIDISNPSGQDYCTDVYLLTRSIGSLDVLYGEYLDLRSYENKIRKQDPNTRMTTDSTGRFLMKGKEQNFCWKIIIGTSTELYLAAPWAQARISNVCCSRQRRPLVGDPFQTNFRVGGASLYPSVSFE